ncbi:MAG TPA: choice-of-anchor D domain-containing protein [Spirochaetota bacterium]|nr:choice-of-anchor D domain-containing protein [Spirochaetota bacterium]
MKNSRIIVISPFLVPLLLIMVCGCAHKRSHVQLPSTLFNNPEISLSESSYNFNGVLLRNNSEREFTVSNTGEESGLEIYSITSDNAEFKIISDNCSSKSLDSWSSCTFVVRFTPRVQGVFSGTISVPSSDPPVREITLAGEGYGLNVWINQVDFSSCSDVQVGVTVNENDNPVESLQNGNHFTLWQNRREESIVSVSTLYNDDPVSMVLALDVSSCLAAALPHMRDHAKTFIGKLNDADEAAVCAFEAGILFYPSSSFLETDADGIDELQDFIDGADPAVTGATALFDAVYDAITRAASGASGKKAVVVFSDGAHNNADGKTLEEVVAYAKEQNVPIFTICYIYPENLIRAQPQVMCQLAEETGGQDYYADETTIESVYTRVRNILGSKYILHYDASPNCSGSIPLRVRVDWNDGTDDLYGFDSRTFTTD